MTTTSIKEVRELVNSLNAKSESLNKLLPIRIGNSTVLGVVDSDNSFYNAMSLAVATRIGLTYYQPYEGPPVGTALAGSTLDIVGVIKNTPFALTDKSGKHHLLSSRLVIVHHLSCGLNTLLPFIPCGKRVRSTSLSRCTFMEEETSSVSAVLEHDACPQISSTIYASEHCYHPWRNNSQSEQQEPSDCTSSHRKSS